MRKLIDFLQKSHKLMYNNISILICKTFFPSSQFSFIVFISLKSNRQKYDFDYVVHNEDILDIAIIRLLTCQCLYKHFRLSFMLLINPQYPNEPMLMLLLEVVVFHFRDFIMSICGIFIHLFPFV